MAFEMSEKRISCNMVVTEYLCTESEGKRIIPKTTSSLFIIFIIPNTTFTVNLIFNSFYSLWV